MAPYQESEAASSVSSVIRHGQVDLRVGVSARAAHHPEGMFGRMFPNLRPFAPDTPEVREALLALGAPAGLMDARDDLFPDLPPDPNNPPPGSGPPPDPELNLNLPTGFTFLGQFLNHDMTFDPTSSLQRQSDPAGTRNFRTPMLELDCVYGAGPTANPWLYDKRGGRVKLLLDANAPWDVPRNSEETALIADPRNDENMIVSQLHLAFLKFHNKVVNELLRQPTPPADVFVEAQRLVRWHYQWMIVHEYLPKVVNQELVDELLSNEYGRRFYTWRDKPFIPVEFAMAVFRFGHSEIRPAYVLKDGISRTLFINPTPFNPNPVDLSGGKRIPQDFIQWYNFFVMGNNPPPTPFMSFPIDTRISSPLFDLPFHGADLPGNVQSLPQRTLLRHVTFGIPSGQDIARFMAIDPLDEQELADLVPFGLEHSTPLWFYILREAKKRANGERLGPVGSRILAEVFIGVLQGDPQSYLTQDPTWRPIFGRRTGEFTIADLLVFAGVT
jgi:hypothetical protein